MTHFANRLTILSDIKKADVEKNRLRRKEAADRKAELQADWCVFEKDASTRLLLAALRGVNSVNIDVRCDFVFSNGFGEKFFFTPSFEQIRRARKIARSEIPQYLDSFVREVRRLPEELLASVQSSLRHFDAGTPMNILSSIKHARLLQDSFIFLQKQMHASNSLIKGEEEARNRRRIRRAKLNDYLDAIRPSISDILDKQMSAIAANSIVHRFGQTSFRSGDAESYFREMIQDRIPQLLWGSNWISRAELRLIVEAARQGRTLIDTARGFPEDSFPGNAPEILELVEEDCDIYSSLPADLGNKYINTDIFFDIFRNVRNIFGLMEVGCNLCRKLLGSDKIFDLIFSAEKPDFFPLAVCASESNPIFETVEFLVSASGRSACKKLEEQLETQAGRGFKSLTFVLNDTDSNLILNQGRPSEIRLGGNLDHFLLVWNHSDGLGLGYEYYEKKSGNHSLKLYWE